MQSRVANLVILFHAGVTEASLEASAGAPRGVQQPRGIESPRFSVLRAHLQGLVLGKPGQGGPTTSSSSAAKGAAWRPMQSSVPRPQRPAGSGVAHAPLLLHTTTPIENGRALDVEFGTGPGPEMQVQMRFLSPHLSALWRQRIGTHGRLCWIRSRMH